MIRIVRARLPRGLQAFARRVDGTVVVVVSAALPAGQRATAIRRALRAAPLAGWRPASSPVLLPALGGGLGARRVPDTRGGWALGGAAVVTAAVVALAIPVTALSAGGDSVAAQPGSHPAAAHSAVSFSGSHLSSGPVPGDSHARVPPALRPQAAGLPGRGAVVRGLGQATATQPTGPDRPG